MPLHQALGSLTGDVGFRPRQNESDWGRRADHEHNVETDVPAVRHENMCNQYASEVGGIRAFGAE
eukprot:5610727-Alexandrium_andersonii.AAC.1